MPFQIVDKPLVDLLLIKPEAFGDDRGFFMESYRKDFFQDLGLTDEFMQDNHSRSGKGVLRGLHYQWQPAQSKLIRVTRGEAWAVAVDIRPDSPCVGQWYGQLLSEENKYMLWAPFGHATGFCTLSECVDVQYKCTGIYNPETEGSILWSDKELAVDWPELDGYTLSAKDKHAQSFTDWQTSDAARHFRLEQPV